MDTYTKHLGKRLTVIGLNGPRTVELLTVYVVGRHVCYNCRVIKSNGFFAIGERENFMGRQILHGGKLVKRIHVLSK